MEKLDIVFNCCLRCLRGSVDTIGLYREGPHAKSHAADAHAASLSGTIKKRVERKGLTGGTTKL